jgi:hypothetical protein
VPLRLLVKPGARQGSRGPQCILLISATLLIDFSLMAPYIYILQVTPLNLTGLQERGEQCQTRSRSPERPPLRARARATIHHARTDSGSGECFLLPPSRVALCFTCPAFFCSCFRHLSIDFLCALMISSLHLGLGGHSCWWW